MQNASFIEQWGALVIAVASFAVAVISLVKSSKAQKLQNKLSEIELKIKNYELEKINAEKAEAEKTLVEARVIQVSKNNYKLKVWNSGNATAYNVSAEFEKESLIRILGDKMPFEELEPNKSFEEIIMVHMGSARKFKITTTWEDASGEKHEKVQTRDL